MRGLCPASNLQRSKSANKKTGKEDIYKPRCFESVKAQRAKKGEKEETRINSVNYVRAFGVRGVWLSADDDCFSKDSCILRIHVDAIGELSATKQYDFVDWEKRGNNHHIVRSRPIASEIGTDGTLTVNTTNSRSPLGSIEIMQCL